MIQAEKMTLRQDFIFFIEERFLAVFKRTAHRKLTWLTQSMLHPRDQTRQPREGNNAKTTEKKKKKAAVQNYNLRLSLLLSQYLYSLNTIFSFSGKTRKEIKA